MEDKQVTISRTNSVITYPCNFIFIASMNPCPCGYYGSNVKKCTCKPEQIKKYISKISGPLLDRIDLHIEVENVEYTQLENQVKLETSDEIRGRVNKARKVQQERYKENGIYSNAELTPKLLSKYCKLDKESKAIMQNAFEKLGLSARAHGRILKVARTIADLDEEENIKVKHIAEAIQYRSLDKKYWNN